MNEETITLDTQIKLLDVVALTQDLPEQTVYRGQVGTVVEILTPGVYEIEFSDDNGKTYATAGVREEQLMLLHLRPCQGSVDTPLKSQDANRFPIRVHPFHRCSSEAALSLPNGFSPEPEVTPILRRMANTVGILLPVTSLS